MTKHKGEDYKISAVQYYLENNTSYVITCEIFKCSERSLKRWIEKYNKKKSIKRYNRKSVSYKITKEQVNYALNLLKKNEQISMDELAKSIKDKFKDFNITPQHLGKVIRDNNKTRKRTRHKHFPKTRYKKPIDQKTELDKFYKEINKYSLNKIISIDETSIKPSMIKEYSRCDLGQRCIVKTDDNIVFQKFTLVVAMSNSKCIGYQLYEKGGMTKERMNEFLDKFVFKKYKNHLIILDNARSHQNKYIKDAITKSGNDYLYSVPYTPKTNAIEMFFNQLKHYLKLNKKVMKYNELKNEIKIAIGKIKSENYKNYFDHAYKKKESRTVRKESTRKRKPKKYK